MLSEFINKYVLFTLVILFSCNLSATAVLVPLVDNVQAFTQNGNPQFAVIDVYKTIIAPQYSNTQDLPKIDDNLVLLHAFNTSLFTSRDALARPTQVESQAFLNALGTMQNDMSIFASQPFPQLHNVLSPLLNNFNNTLSLIRDRYGLAKIEDMVINGNGFLGMDVLPNIPDGPPANSEIFRQTIQCLIGRIFVVKNTNTGPVITGTSSGMIIPYKTGEIVQYDTVITCCHSMILQDPSPDLEFYFIRSQSLDNPAAGLPTAAAIGAVVIPTVTQNQDQIINTQHFIEYMRQESVSMHSNNVRRIMRFKPMGKQASELGHHAPRHHAHEDGGYGVLNNGFYFSGANFAEVTILRNPPGGVYDYYALGYPTFSYYNSAGQGPLVAEQRLSPFAMTKTRSNLRYPNTPNAGLYANQSVLMVTNGYLRHGASTMKGMSGGPLLRFDVENNKIDILGVISSGIMNFNYACRFG